MGDILLQDGIYSYIWVGMNIPAFGLWANFMLLIFIFHAIDVLVSNRNF